LKREWGKGDGGLPEYTSSGVSKILAQGDNKSLYDYESKRSSFVTHYVSVLYLRAEPQVHKQR